MFVTVIKAVPIPFPVRMAVAPAPFTSTTAGLLESQVYPSNTADGAFFTLTDTDFVFPSPTATTLVEVVR